MFVSAPGFPRPAIPHPAMPLPWPPLFSPSALSAAATAECAPTQLTALPLPWPPRFPPPTLSAAFPKSTPIQPPQANTTLLTRASNSPSHAPKFHHASSPAVYLPPKKAVAPQSMPIKAKPLHLEKPQAAMTNTPAAVAQAAPDLQLLNRQPHPYSHLHCTGSCIPDLGDDCVACLDQSSVQRPSSASHSGPTPLPAITQGPPEERTSTIPAILAAMRPNGQPHQRPQTQLAQPPALSDNSSSRRSEVQCQAVKLDQRPNALPHSMPQKSLKMHLVSNGDDAEAQAHKHRDTQIHAKEQHEEQIHAQEQHVQMVHAKQASQKQTPVAELPRPLDQVLPRPPEAKPKQTAPAALRAARPPTKQLAFPQQLPQKLQAPQLSKPALPLEVQPNLKQVSQTSSLTPSLKGQQLQVSLSNNGAKQVAELQQLSQHDLSSPLENAQTSLAASALPQAALKTTSGVVTESVPCQHRQESLAVSGMPSIAQGSGLASRKKHTLECISNTGAGSQSPPNKKKRCMRSYQAELTSQSDKAANRAAAEHTLTAPADQSPQSRETRDEVSHLSSASRPEPVSTPSATDTSRSSTCISDSSFSCGSTSGSMLTASNTSSGSLSNGGYGGLSWQVNKSLTDEDLLSLKSKDITVTYTWDPSNAVMGEVAVTAWVCSTNIMGWRWSDSGKHHFDAGDACAMSPKAGFASPSD